MFSPISAAAAPTCHVGDRHGCAAGVGVGAVSDCLTARGAAAGRVDVHARCKEVQAGACSGQWARLARGAQGDWQQRRGEVPSRGAALPSQGGTLHEHHCLCRCHRHCPALVGAAGWALGQICHGWNPGACSPLPCECAALRACGSGSRSPLQDRPWERRFTAAAGSGAPPSSAPPSVSPWPVTCVGPLVDVLGVACGAGFGSRAKFDQGAQTHTRCAGQAGLGGGCAVSSAGQGSIASKGALASQLCPHLLWCRWPWWARWRQPR